MKLSAETLTVLRNFASINPNLVIKPGSNVKTIAESKTVLASADVAETFPQEVGIYDLSSFLTQMSLINDPELVFAEDGQSIDIADGTTGESVKYFLSDSAILTSPTKDISMPSTDVEFKLTEVQLDKIRKAANALSCTDIVVSGSSGSSDVTVEVTDVKVSTANRFRLNLGNVDTRPEGDFKLIFNVNNFKFLPGNFNVKVSSRLISEFENTDTGTTYWVALEKSSSFGG